MSDDRGRPCLGDLVRDRPERLFHVGRLDADTEGLLLLTNDGELAHRLMHPSYEVSKTYLAEVEGTMSRATLRALLAGVDLDDGPARADAVKISQSAGGTPWSRSCCMKVGIESSADSWPRLGIRWFGWCERGSARCSWAVSGSERYGT